VKIALAQLNYRIGDFEKNIEKIIDFAQIARLSDADLVVFSELAVCGYPPFDLLKMNDFIRKCEQAVDTIAEKCFDIPILLGTPQKNSSGKGNPLFNTAVFLHQGKRKYFGKTTLSENIVLNEKHYFEPTTTIETLDFKGKKIAISIGEAVDLAIFSSKNPDLTIILSASCFDYTQAEKRAETIRNKALQLQCPLLFVNQVGAQTGFIFDGGSMAVSANGIIAQSLPFFEEKMDFVDIETLSDFKLKTDRHNHTSKVERIYHALILGIRDYFEKSGFRKAVLGLSGGIDSALVMTLTAKALGAQNVLGVLMPSRFSTDHSVNDAVALAKKLGCPHKTISIEPAFKIFQESLNPIFENRPFDITEENLQARIRAVLLMAISNKFGNMLLNTSNKSECAVGYGTLYGDTCGGLSVLGDLYKTEVFEMARWINRNEEIIPWNTINKPPSAELRPDQKDCDSLPDYNILDQILFQHIENEKSAEEISNLGFEITLVKRVLRMVASNEYKRYQAAPTLRVSPKAFGYERHFPIVMKLYN
jgi:NAD+ synthase (glutamine-hydrolysing)